ncbi:nucleotide exchange factor GrpE [Sporosarcina sp. JAI121]|uniref:nucleotide exchange factor GrpE n=1 Tax=Sporosarcina sp. JAI121 TaxID=2723064 RepID=UPI0015CEF476|nr:nucleotide exchange factor GrpE [Sporosarcina sp. JAI121]NYF24931.1 molecular chaperone GrpE [Sporosarcina sp. JAI121]
MTNVNDEVEENGKTVVEASEEANETIDSDEKVEEIEIVENGNDTIVQELTEKLQEEENKRLRLLADYENFKRRASLDKEALQKYRAQNVVTNLIPVLDNFARALTVETKTEEAQTMLTGLDMIYRTFVQALEDEGLVEIKALDQEFDPNFHQAIMTGKDEDKPSGIVLEEMQAGYMLKDRVLRPAMVKVNE